MAETLPNGPTSRVEAYAMLTHHALSALWMSSDFQPREDGDDIWGCCPGCCAPCGALHYLDRSGVLDAILAEWPEGHASSSMFAGDRLDRVWMYRQWSNPAMLAHCEHEAPEAGRG